jgi:hypothetical protein
MHRSNPKRVMGKRNIAFYYEKLSQEDQHPFNRWLKVNAIGGINIPIGIYRGFRSLTDAPDALLMAIIGGPDAGKVDWHPSVLEEARKTGLSVDDEGNLIIEKPAA